MSIESESESVIDAARLEGGNVLGRRLGTGGGIGFEGIKDELASIARVGRTVVDVVGILLTRASCPLTYS